jgi:hypothetical protein
VHTRENPSLRVREGLIVEEDPRLLRIRLTASDVGFPNFAWLFRHAFWKRVCASADDEVKGANDPSLNPYSDHGEVVHGGFGCDY